MSDHAERRAAGLASLLAMAEVRVSCAGNGGSGFFVAPRTVVTCAHVVGGRVGAPVRVTSRGEEFQAEVVACRSPSGAMVGGRYPHPDLAVIRVDGCGEYPCVLLDRTPIEPGDELLVQGHTRSWSPADALAESERFRWSGQVDTNNEGDFVVKLGGGQAVAGMSGGPVLNLRSGRVCGVLRTSRDTASDLGAWIVTASTLLEVFPWLAEEHRTYHRHDLTWRKEADRWADVFEPEQLLPSEYPPSFLLRSEFGIVPFFGRAAELAELSEWCASNTRVAVAIVTGPGGQGKTRMAKELCGQLVENGWTAGFVRPNATPEHLTRLLAEDAPCLLVIDYAEIVADRIHAFGQIIAQTPAERVRLLLVARSAGDWLSKTREDADETLASLLFRAKELKLESLTFSVEDRRAGFLEALDAFVERLGINPTLVQPPPDLDQPHYGLALTLHMVALATLLDSAEHRDLGTAWGDPVGRVMDHERRYWRRSASAIGLPPLGDNLLGYVVAAATLCSAPDQRTAMRLLSAVPDLADQPHTIIRRYLQWIVDLHPGVGWLNPLQPDRLGEDHVADMLRRVPDLADALISAADEAQVRKAFTVLARAAPRHEHVQPILLGLLSTDPARLLPTGLEAAMQVRDPQPLADAISAALPALNDDRVLARLYALLPRSSVALAHLAEQVTRRVTNISRLVYDDTDPKHGVWLRNLAVRLSDIGDTEQALAVADRAVSLLRPAAAAAKYRNPLAAALNTVGAQRLQLGRLDEALEVCREAASLYEQLNNPADLAGCLNNLAAILARLGKPKEAAEYCNRAVAIRRSVVEDNDSLDLRSQLAMILVSHTIFLRAIGRYGEAEAAATEAIQTLRPLAEARPDEHGPDLAHALENLGALLGERGRFEQALESTREGVSICQRLATGQPDRYQPQLRASLNVHAGILLNLQHDTAAFNTIAESVAICRTLVENRPDAHLDDITHDVANLMTVATRIDRCPDALDILHGVVSQLRRLMSEPSGRRNAALASVLTAYCNVLTHNGDYAEAVAAGEEAVTALNEPGMEQPDKLAMALAALAVAQANDGTVGACLEAATAAIKLYRAGDGIRLITKHNVAGCISDLVLPLTNAGHTHHAAWCAQQAVLLQEEVVEQNPAYELGLATALHAYAVTIWGAFPTGLQWQEPIERAIEIRRRWAARSTKARAGLDLSLLFKAHVLQGQPTAHSPGPRRTPTHHRKVPRNSPCPCGSGRKYKRCCGAPNSENP